MLYLLRFNTVKIFVKQSFLKNIVLVIYNKHKFITFSNFFYLFIANNRYILSNTKRASNLFVTYHKIKTQIRIYIYNFVVKPERKIYYTV